MGKLLFSAEELRQRQEELVPALFTARQFELLLNKAQEKTLNATEQAYFSRSISPKIRALHSFFPPQKYFMQGEEMMLPPRKSAARKLLKTLERKHKGLRILITGSFLYNKKHKDIDVFFISSYEKEDFFSEGMHFNYLTPDIISTLFFASLAKLSVSNFNLSFPLTEDIELPRIISLSQEIIKDIREKNVSWLKRDLRDFLLETTYCREGVILDSRQLHQQVERVLKLTNPTSLLMQMLMQTLLLGFPLQEVRQTSKQMLVSYSELKKEYPSANYDSLVHSFSEVLQSAS